MNINDLPEIQQLAINVAKAREDLRKAQFRFDEAIEAMSRLGRSGVDAAQWASNIKTAMSKNETVSTRELIERLKLAGKL